MNINELSKSQISALLEERIKKGIDLVNTSISTIAELEQEIHNYYLWNSYNDKLLESISPELKKRYSTPTNFYSIINDNLEDLISKHFHSLKIKITFLKSIIEQLDFYITPKTSIMNNMTDSTTFTPKFNILYKDIYGCHNIMNISTTQLTKAIEAYRQKREFDIKGETYDFSSLSLFKIYTYSNYQDHEQNMVNLESKKLISSAIYKTFYYPESCLAELGNDVTEEYLDAPLNQLQSTNQTEQVMEQYDYAIITALYKDELELVETFINFDSSDKSDEKKLIKFGSLKSDTTKKVVYASLPSTGMVDAAIVTTEIITRYTPKYVFMTGVCGGRDTESINIGDVVIADKVFMFEKGKHDNEDFAPELNVVEIDSKTIGIIQSEEANILAAINKGLHSIGTIHIAPMACSMSVINKEGFFEENITSKDRKTLALEMEGYSVARACKLCNNNQTKALIIKAVMDKTNKKNDKAKALAGRNSAIFLKHLLEGGYLEKY